MSNNSAKVTTQPVNGVTEAVAVIPTALTASTASNNAVAVNNTAIERLQQLESLFLGGPIMSSATATSEAKCFSTETLLDVLMVLYNECCNSSLRKEKTVSEFIELGKAIIFAILYNFWSLFILSTLCSYGGVASPTLCFIDWKFLTTHVYSLYMVWYFQLMSAEGNLKISWMYLQILSSEDRAKHCFTNEWTLV